MIGNSNYVLSVLLFAIIAIPAFGQEKKTDDLKGVRAEAVAIIEDAGKKYIALAKAFPQEKYSWRPAKGVRSVSEVFTHIAGANYLISTFAGATPPPEFQGREKAFKKMGEMAKISDKKTIIAELEKSFKYLRSAISKMNDEDLEKPADFFGTKTTARGILGIIGAHAHQHLGQSIAYARVNNITPPWSGGRN